MTAARGIRLRITAFATLAVAVMMLTAGLVLVIVQERLLTDNLDEILLSHNENLEDDFLVGRLRPLLAQQGSSDAIAQVTFGTTVVAATENMTGQPALDPPRGDVQRRTLSLAIDESTYRLLSRRVGDAVIHTGTPIDDVEEASDALRVGLAYGIPTVTAMLALLVWWLVGRTLRPVESIRTQVAGISANSLQKRVPVPATGDEIAELATTMNDMLARVEAAVERQQRFVADASHELRSPLTRVRTELEVDEQHPDTADPAATHRSVLEEVARLQQLIDDLLHLARSDAIGQLREPVDLAPLIEHEVARATDRTSTMVAISTSVAEAWVSGDAAQLARLIRNVLDNAIRHARSTVAVASLVMGDVVRITIDDDGPGIPLHERARVFERFARLDEARSAADGGTGLGLAIAHDIVDRHGGTIGVETSPLGGARLVVHLLAVAPPT